MNTEKVEGKFDQVIGKVKQKTGEAVGNQKLANSGVADQVKGAAKETWGKVKDTPGEVSDTAHTRAEVKGADLKRRAESSAHDIREKITSTTENVKNKISAKLDDIKNRQRQDRG